MIFDDQASIIPSIQTDLILINIQIYYMYQIDQSPDEPQTQTIILNPPYQEELALKFTPNYNYRLTEDQYQQSIFDYAKQDILCQHWFIKGSALVVMRRIMGFPSVRGNPYVRQYIQEHLIDMCYNFLSKISKIQRYQACFTLDNLANDTNLCSLLITQKDCIGNLLIFIGIERYIQIRDKAISALRKVVDKICLNQCQEQLINQTFLKAIENLRIATTRIQIRQIVWIIQRLYNSEVGQKNQLLVLTFCRMFCEVLKINLLKPEQKQELTCFIQGLYSIFCREPKFTKFVASCIKDYQILDIFMVYADSKEEYSGTAMKILQKVAFTDLKVYEKFVQSNMFVYFVVSLIQNHKEQWQKIVALCKILKKMAEWQQFIKKLFVNIEFLKILNTLLQENDQQLTLIICEMYQNIIERAPEEYWDQIIDLIMTQNILEVIINLIQPDEEGEITYLWPGLRIIQETLNFGCKNQGNRTNQILERFMQLGIAQKLKKFEESPIFELKRTAENIRIIYWPEKGEQDEFANQTKQTKQNKESTESSQEK